jgi:hypothetical protein
MTIRDTLTGSGLIRRLRGPRFVSAPSTPRRRRHRYERAGDVQFHYDVTWHCSAPNPAAHPRRALSIHVFNADARYREGGRVEFPELSHGDLMDAVAPLVIETRADVPT